ncbi:hypothetical protein CCACVL1_27653 [Corchorus capsularis]|uniref:Uncharacterized protein n=1 Tax=Corchorus capsularis TaxID=210143 RepID=A0A1R3G9E7_COCAP|nr:hypothetical protein CCACVL1_27653 [Corchorus capsularis]
MGNEMGNNTSGLQVEDNITQEKSQQEVAAADDVKGQNYVAPVAQDKDSQGKETEFASADIGREDHSVDEQKSYDKELKEDNMKTEGEKPLQEAGRTDDVKGQNHEVVASEDANNNEKETGLAPSNLEVAEPHDDKQNQDEKGEDSNMIPETKEQSLQEAATNEAKGQDHLVPAAAEVMKFHENETELNSTEPDSMTSPHVDNQKQDEKEDNSTNLEADEKSLQEAASENEVKHEADLVLAPGEENNHETETGLVSIEDKKEEDSKIKDEANSKSSNEAVNMTDDVERQDHLVQPIENETGLVSTDPEGTADSHVDSPKQDEKGEDKENDETRERTPTIESHADDIEVKNLIIPASESEGSNKVEAEAELASSDAVVAGLEHTLDNQTLEGREQGETELHPPAESTKVEAKPSQEISEGREMQAASQTKNLEDHEMHRESNSEQNLSETVDHFEDQNSMMTENEGARNSISDAVSSTSHDLVPHQEPSVLEPEQSKLAETETEQHGEVCNEPQKSEHMVISSLTSPDQQNGFISDSGVSTEMVESAFVDSSPKVEKGMDDILVEKKATKELSNEERFELEDGNNINDDSATAMTDLPNEFGAKCNGELPSEMNSIRNDSPESHVEAILSDEAQIFQQEVSKTNGNFLVPGQNAILAREEAENGDMNKSHCKTQSVESVEQSNGKESEEGSKPDEPKASLPQFMMNSYESKEKRCLLDTNCDSNSKGCQFEEAKIVENGHHVDVPINNKNEATKEQQKDSSGNEVHLVTHTAMVPTGTFLTHKEFKEEESEEKKIIEEIVEKDEGSVANGNTTLRREKPAIANGDHYQQETVGRLSNESSPDNISIHAEMRKSPSFNLDLRIDARPEESDQTPLLYQDKTTIDDSFSSQADHVALGKVTESKTEYKENSFHYEEAMQVEEKVVTLERSDSEKSKTPFLGFLKEEEEEAQLLVTPKNQDNPSATNKAAIKVSIKEVASASQKGKEKRKPKVSLFGTCMCCATVIN